MHRSFKCIILSLQPWRLNVKILSTFSYFFGYFWAISHSQAQTGCYKFMFCLLFKSFLKIKITVNFYLHISGIFCGNIKRKWYTLSRLKLEHSETTWLKKIINKLDTVSFHSALGTLEKEFHLIKLNLLILLNRVFSETFFLLFLKWKSHGANCYFYVTAL